MAQIADLNPHDRPPHAILQAYKKHQKLPLPGIASDESIIDLQSLDPDHLPPGISLQRWTLSENLRPAFDQFVHEDNGFVGGALPVFTHQSVSGKRVAPPTRNKNQTNLLTSSRAANDPLVASSFGPNRIIVPSIPSRSVEPGA